MILLHACMCWVPGRNFTFPAATLHRNAGEALAPPAPATSGLGYGAQSLGATSFLWPQVPPARMHVGNKKVVTSLSEMSFKHFISRGALKKISVFIFFLCFKIPILWLAVPSLDS